MFFMEFLIISIFLFTSTLFSPAVSTSNAHTLLWSDFRNSGISFSFSIECNPARSINSTAETGVDFRQITALQACSISWKIISELALQGCSITVLKLISEIKPNVPSDPIIRCSIISNGSEKSIRALRLYPVVFFILYFFLIFSAREVFSVASFARFSISERIVKCDSLNAILLDCSLVSRIVPSAMMILIPATVL